MISFFRKKTKESSEITLLKEIKSDIDLRHKELSAQIKDLQLGLISLENKLFVKDLKDKQNYGLLHYKLHEVKPQLDQAANTEEVKKKNLKNEIDH